jgi:RHS repeat-associated protein
MEWYLSDHLGSTTLLINESGLEVERTEYYPYGQVQSGGLEKYGFTGQENDADTELMYYGARYYSPEYRIFVQPDTMLPNLYNPQALNRYSYTLNNPVKYTDPSGHYIESALDIAFLAMDLNDIRTGNANKWTYIGLGTDAVCLLLPGVTGGRLGVKALEETVTHADNVGDLFKFLDKTVESANSVNKVDNLYDAAKSTVGLADGIEVLDVLKSSDPNYLRRYLKYDGKTIQINTGHGYRPNHPAGGDVTGFGSINEIESEIVMDVNSAANSGINIPTNTAIERTVNVNGNKVGYSLTQLKDGTYSVSTYYPKI